MGGSIDCPFLFLINNYTGSYYKSLRITYDFKLGVYPNDNPVLPDCTEFLFDIAALPRACEYTDLSR